MVAIRLTLSCGDYDRTRPLIDGVVPTSGMDLTVIPLPSAERHTRFVANFEFDVCELQIAQYLGFRSNGVPITAIPVFPHRRFNHSCVMVRLDSDIARPKICAGAAWVFMRISIRSRSGSAACCSTSSMYRRARFTGLRTLPNT